MCEDQKVLLPPARSKASWEMVCGHGANTGDWVELLVLPEEATQVCHNQARHQEARRPKNQSRAFKPPKEITEARRSIQRGPAATITPEPQEVPHPTPPYLPTH